MMKGAHKEYVARVAQNLQRSLEDIQVKVRAVPITTAFQQTAWIVEVETPDITLAFSPYQLDNGAEGIKEKYLVDIRKAYGQSIDLPNRYMRTDPYARFSDIISVNDDE